jgi:hypothetical protein
VPRQSPSATEPSGEPCPGITLRVTPVQPWRVSGDAWRCRAACTKFPVERRGVCARRDGAQRDPARGCCPTWDRQSSTSHGLPRRLLFASSAADIGVTPSGGAKSVGPISRSTRAHSRRTALARKRARSATPRSPRYPMHTLGFRRPAVHEARAAQARRKTSRRVGEPSTG